MSPGDGDATQHFTISSREQIDRATGVCATVAPHFMPLLCAARDGLINLVHPGRAASIPKSALFDARRPIIVVIGDDDHAATGPDGWQAARRLRYWGRGALIHATGAEIDHYRFALFQAMTIRQFILIETDTANQEQWCRLLRSNMPTLLIRAKEDCSHPKAPDHGEVN